MSESERERQDFSDSDRLWFDRLAGRPVPADQLGSDAVRQADALRAALAADERASDADPDRRELTAPAALEHEWQALQFALRREGLLRVPAPNRRRWMTGLGMAAATLMAAGLVLHLQRGDDFGEPPTLRGEVLVYEHRSADPAAGAKAFAASLRKAGLPASLYRRGTTYIVDVDLRPEHVAAARETFAGLGLTASIGYWRIEFSAP